MFPKVIGLLVAFAGTFHSGVALKTTYKCQAIGSWGDYCYYENICFDSAKDLVFIQDHFVKENNGKRGGVHFTTKLPLNELKETRRYPAMTHPNARGVSEADFESLEVDWVDDTKGAAYISYYNDKLANIWYWSTRMLPLFSAEYYADMLGLPPVGFVIVPMEEHKVTHPWHKGMVKLLLNDPETPIYFGRSPPYNAMQGDAGRLLCAKRAVLMGAQVYAFPDMMVGHAFKQRAYEAVGLPPPPIQQVKTPDLPAVVTILDRGRDKPRHIYNLEAVKKIIHKYDVEIRWVVLGDDVSFEEQVKTFATTGVLVSVHGAGLMNQVFMPPGSVTVEIFPNHVKHVLYSRIAHYSGIYHLPVYANEMVDGYHEKNPGYNKHNCSEVLSMEVPEHENGYCWRLVKNTVVKVPLQPFEEALVQALDFVKRTTLV